MIYCSTAFFFGRQNQLVMMMARKNVLFSLGRPNLSPLGTKFTSLPDFACSGGTHIIFGILNVKTKLSAYANGALKKEAQNMVTYQRLICCNVAKQASRSFLFVRNCLERGFLAVAVVGNIILG